jgi:hypothetical protein
MKKVALVLKSRRDGDSARAIHEAPSATTIDLKERPGTLPLGGIPDGLATRASDAEYCYD